jgi:hypothetical protein
MDAARDALIATKGSTPMRISNGTLKAPHAAAEIPMTQPDANPTKAIAGTETITRSSFLEQSQNSSGAPMTVALPRG